MIDAQTKDRSWWESYFAVGGDWERLGGRQQTRVFAEHFMRHADLIEDANFSLLDAGCALGDALEIFAAALPKAHLYGLDFSSVAIARARQLLGDKAKLTQGDIGSVDGHFDAVYCSNTLEHFADFDQKARRLLQHCNRLFVMVPFHELRNGQPLRPDPTDHHQHTFERDSFDFLLREGLASRIDVSIFACPGAWGWSAPEYALQFLKNLMRVTLGRHWIRAPYQVLYNIHATSASRM
jgi:SAM-dependent methyltransferase